MQYRIEWNIMNHMRSPFATFCLWLVYALLAPIIIVSWCILLQFNPYDSYWFYDSSLVAHSLLHPVNLIGFLAYLFGVSAVIILIALTHALFRFTQAEAEPLCFIDYVCGYLFLIIGLSGLSAFFGFDPLNAVACGGLFGQQLHVLFAQVPFSVVEQIMFQILLFWGTCMSIGFYWAHYVVVVIALFLYPLKMLVCGFVKIIQKLRSRFVRISDFIVHALWAQDPVQQDDLESVVYEITRMPVSESNL